MAVDSLLYALALRPPSKLFSDLKSLETSDIKLRLTDRSDDRVDIRGKERYLTTSRTDGMLLLLNVELTLEGGRAGAKYAAPVPRRKLTS
jgi:hypothetical protein